jgi:hypothetical protein
MVACTAARERLSFGLDAGAAMPAWAVASVSLICCDGASAAIVSRAVARAAEAPGMVNVGAGALIVTRATASGSMSAGAKARAFTLSCATAGDSESFDVGAGALTVPRPVVSETWTRGEGT